MKIFLKNYTANSSVTSLPYHRALKLKSKWSENHLSLHIPCWNYLTKTRIEIVMKDYAAIIHGKNDAAFLLTGDSEKALAQANVFRILNEWELLWKKYVSNRHYFYLGLLSYDLYHAIENIPMTTDFYQLPDFFILLPGNTLLIDHSRKEAQIFSLSNKGLTIKKQTFESASSEKAFVQVSESKEAYLNKIRAIRELIFAGEVYQINYTIRFSVPLKEQSYAFFRRLYQINPAPYSFYANLPQVDILSISPERFLLQEADKVSTEPIKGTIPRSSNLKEDKLLREQLLQSNKDRAELSMIVDLLRNDLSKVCLPGSVKVESHSRVESFTNVHHLVSTVKGQLKPAINYIDLLRAAFPGGSITGCPKIAAINYIRQMELHNRSFYTGTFFIRFPSHDQFDSSILIRTGLVRDNKIHFQTGGGVVIDSDPESEYQECLAKAGSFFKAVKQEK